MSVDFTDNGDGTHSCDVCGEDIDSDHYNDMVAHEEEHRKEEQRVADLPGTVIMFTKGVGYTVLQKSADGVYVSAAVTQSYETARKLQDAL